MRPQRPQQARRSTCRGTVVASAICVPLVALILGVALIGAAASQPEGEALEDSQISVPESPADAISQTSSCVTELIDCCEQSILRFLDPSHWEHVATSGMPSSLR